MNNANKNLGLLVLVAVVVSLATTMTVINKMSPAGITGAPIGTGNLTVISSTEINVVPGFDFCAITAAQGGSEQALPCHILSNNGSVDVNVSATATFSPSFTNTSTEFRLNTSGTGGFYLAPFTEVNATALLIASNVSVGTIFNVNGEFAPAIDETITTFLATVNYTAVQS